MMRLKAAFSGRLDELLRLEQRVVLRASNSMVRRATTLLQRELRADIKAAGLRGLVKPLRRSVKPPKGGNRRTDVVEGFVYSAADYKRPGGKIDLATVLEAGGDIRPNRRRWLAVPLDGVGRGRAGRGGANARLRPEDWPKGTLFFRPTRNPNVALLVYRQRGKPDTPMYILVKQTRVRPRFNRRRANDLAFAAMPEFFNDAYERLGQKTGLIDSNDDA